MGLNFCIRVYYKYGFNEIAGLPLHCMKLPNQTEEITAKCDSSPELLMPHTDLWTSKPEIVPFPLGFLFHAGKLTKKYGLLAKISVTLMAV